MNDIFALSGPSVNHDHGTFGRNFNRETEFDFKRVQTKMLNKSGNPKHKEIA